MCHGKRLRPESLAVKVNGMSIADFTSLPIARALEAARDIKLTGRELTIAGRIAHEITERLEFLHNVGLGYLSLGRSAATLSGGEGQRIRLATQIGSKLRGVLYVLDEPSIGLHHRDNGRLLAALENLRDLGNTVLVVEHDEETIRRADYVIDLGPGAGRHGGELVAAGTPAEIMNSPASLTGAYIAGRQRIAMLSERRSPNGKAIAILGARENNLKNLDVVFPARRDDGGHRRFRLRQIHSRQRHPVPRVSQATLSLSRRGGRAQIHHWSGADRQGHSHRPVSHRTHPALQSRNLYRNIRGGSRPLRHAARIARARIQARTLLLQRFRRTLRGLPGRRPAPHRNELPARRLRAVRSLRRTPLQPRDACRCTTTVTSIADLLEMPVSDVLQILENIPQVKQKLQTLVDVGLGYIHLGQSAVTLSGGEAQRIKLARELGKRQTGKTLYLLDEPTTGLHFDDVRKLLDVLHRLTDLGNTVIIIEHNLDVIRNADWIVDLGPEGGEEGGRIVAQGTPEQVARVKKSYTGQALSAYFTGSEKNGSAKNGSIKNGSAKNGSPKNGSAKNGSAKSVLAPTGTGELA